MATSSSSGDGKPAVRSTHSFVVSGTRFDVDDTQAHQTDWTWCLWVVVSANNTKTKEKVAIKGFRRLD